MRQKFPGVAKIQEQKWRTKGEIWDYSISKWVKFVSNANNYIQASIEYEKQKRR